MKKLTEAEKERARIRKEVRKEKEDEDNKIVGIFLGIIMVGSFILGAIA